MAPGLLAAQADTARGAVEGTVYDSVTRRPLAGAIVQMVNAASPAGAVRSAESDARGRYQIGGLEAGRYVLGFQHVALDTLALASPTVVVEIRAGTTATADLATPSPAAIVEAACRVSVADSTGLLIGLLRDAETGASRTRGQVEARWVELVLDNAGLRTEERIRSGAISADGWFALCLPAAEGIAVRASSESDSSGLRLVDIPASGMVRHDIALGGTALVRGRIMGEGRLLTASAYVGFTGTDRRVMTDSAGAFVLEGPAGTQTLEARALGFVAARIPLALRPGADTVMDVSLLSLKRVLDTVQVRASRVYSRDSDGFLRRRRSGNGRFWGPEDFERGRFHDIYGALRMAPGVTMVQAGFERTLTIRGGITGRCAPAVYLNGVQLGADFMGDLDLLVRPDEISGMELYTVAQAPAQYQPLNGCGSLVIWTRPRQPRR